MSWRRALCVCVLWGSVACHRNEPAPKPPAAPPAEMKAEPSPAPEAPLVFGLAMPLGLDATQESAAALSDYFSAALKRPVQARLFAYDELSNALTAKQVDIAYISPLVYVKVTKQVPLTILRRAVHGESSSYVSVLFVRGDSPLKSIDSLKGKRVAWVQKGSASGNLFPRAAVKRQKQDLKTFFGEQLFLADHSKVCEAVFEKRVDVGATFADFRSGAATPLALDGCRAALGDEKLKQLRVISASEPIPNDVVAVRVGTPASVVEALQSALDQITATPAGQAALKKGFHADGFAPGSDADFGPVRTLAESFADGEE